MLLYVQSLTAVVYSLQYKVRGLDSYCLETAVQLTNTEVDYGCIPLILAINSLSSSTFFLFSLIFRSTIHNVCFISSKLNLF